MPLRNVGAVTQRQNCSTNAYVSSLSLRAPQFSFSLLFYSFRFVCVLCSFSRSTFRMCYCCWLCFLVSVALMRTNKFRLRFVIASTVRNAFFPLLATASFRTIIFVALLHFGFSTIYFLIFSIIFVQLNTLGIILMRIVVPI